MSLASRRAIVGLLGLVAAAPRAAQAKAAEAVRDAVGLGDAVVIKDGAAGGPLPGGGPDRRTAIQRVLDRIVLEQAEPEGPMQ